MGWLIVRWRQRCDGRRSRRGGSRELHVVRVAAGRTHGEQGRDPGYAGSHVCRHSPSGVGRRVSPCSDAADGSVQQLSRFGSRGCPRESRDAFFEQRLGTSQHERLLRAAHHLGIAFGSSHVAFDRTRAGDRAHQSLHDRERGARATIRSYVSRTSVAAALVCVFSRLEAGTQLGDELGQFGVRGCERSATFDTSCDRSHSRQHARHRRGACVRVSRVATAQASLKASLKRVRQLHDRTVVTRIGDSKATRQARKRRPNEPVLRLQRVAVGAPIRCSSLIRCHGSVSSQRFGGFRKRLS